MNSHGAKENTMYDSNKERKLIQEYTSRARAEAAKAAKAAGTTVAQYWENRWATEDIYEEMLDSLSEIQDTGFYAEDDNGDYEVNTFMFDDGSLFLELVTTEEDGKRIADYTAFDNVVKAKERLDEHNKAKAAKV